MRGEVQVHHGWSGRHVVLATPSFDVYPHWTWGVELRAAGTGFRLLFTMGQMLGLGEVAWYATAGADLGKGGALRWFDEAFSPLAEAPELVEDNALVFEWLREQLDTLRPLEGNGTYAVPDVAAVGARVHTAPPPYASWRAARANPRRRRARR